MSCGTENIFMEPVDIYLGKDQAMVQKVTCVADTAAAPLSGKYFLLYTEAGLKHCVHFGTAPTLPGYTMVPVTFTALDTAEEIATAVQTAVDALAAYTAAVVGKVVTITHVNNGYAYPAHDSEAAKTNFAFEIVTVGDLFEKVGALDGDVEVSALAGEKYDITTHQTGTTVMSQITMSAGNPELSFTIKEVIYSKLAKLKRYSSGEYLPVGGTAALAGGGSLGQFKPAQNVRIVLHPVSKGLADKSSDWCFWKTVIDIDSKTFSGENVSMIPVTAKAFKDCNKPAAIDTWVQGDWTQIEAI